MSSLLYQRIDDNPACHLTNTTNAQSSCLVLIPPFLKLNLQMAEEEGGDVHAAYAEMGQSGGQSRGKSNE